MPISERWRFRWRNPRGSLLVLTLWIIAFATLLSFSISYHVRQKISLADRIDRRNWLAGVAEAGVYRSVYQVALKKEAAEGYHALNDKYTGGETVFGSNRLGEAAWLVSYERPDPLSGELRAFYGLEDEEGKANINRMDAKTLAAFLKAASEIEEDLAVEIASSIVDWRDKNNSPSDPKFGAEDDYYEDLDLPYESKDIPFESIYELELVRGMTPEIFEKIKPYVTLFGSGQVNINTALKPVMMGLGMEESLADKVIKYRAGQDGVEGTSDDNIFMDAAMIAPHLAQAVKLSGGEAGQISRLTTRELLGVDSSYFRIRSLGISLQKQQVVAIDAVANLEGTILAWHAGIPRRMTPFEVEISGRNAQT